MTMDMLDPGFYTSVFHLQRSARRAWPTSRTAACCVRRVGGRSVDVLRDAEKKRAKYQNVMRCGSVWMCPVCAAQLTARRRDDLKKVLDTVGRMTIPVMVTFTVSHQREDPLHDTIALINDSWHDLTALKSWRAPYYDVFGYVRAFEVTWGPGNGWHPHFHALFFLDVQTCVNKWFEVIKKEWIKIVDRMGGYASEEHGVMLSPVIVDDAVVNYFVKWGLEGVESNTWSVASEMTRGHVKKARYGESLTPWGMLDLVFTDHERGPAYWLYLLRQYSTAIKGKRQLVWSRSPDPRKLAGIMSPENDQEIIDTPDPAYRIFTTLTPEEWDHVIKSGYDGAILDAVADGDMDLVDKIKTFAGMVKLLAI